ncbi:MAG TPA: NTP transferase domain-containing protein, partial [Bacillota bacterium]|nr:NTP transferase domain-containing protein [Bacillota bacterium]
MTLVILAAGLGSRYGGLKQLEPINKYGEFIIDYSVFDAKRAGFDRVVFVIKEENYNAFRETIGRRIEGHIKVEYAFQKIEDIPSWAEIPEGRTKPWGTTQALLAARDIVDDNFAVC